MHVNLLLEDLNLNPLWLLFVVLNVKIKLLMLGLLYIKLSVKINKVVFGVVKIYIV